LSNAGEESEADEGFIILEATAPKRARSSTVLYVPDGFQPEDHLRPNCAAMPIMPVICST
jgi:hypothetical protein